MDSVCIWNKLSHSDIMMLPTAAATITTITTTITNSATYSTQ